MAGISVARDDTIWVIYRQLTLTDDEKGAALSPPRSRCCVAAPPVLQFDRQGNLLHSWGGNAATDHMLFKFTPEGKYRGEDRAA